MWTYQHTDFLVHQIPALNDNYIYLIQDCHSDAVCVVDPALADSVQTACEMLNLKPTHILNTHHHWDHTDGNKALIEKYDVQVIANASDAARIPGISQPIPAQSNLKVGSLNIQTLDLPGHTLGHIAFVVDDALFCGDTLFGAGCGRVFEGSMAQMWDSLQKLYALKDEMKVYCAHEYTLPNLRFAKAVDKDNETLKKRISDDTRTRMKQQPTIPSTLGLEKQTNPFLRPFNPDFVRHYNQANNSDMNGFAVFKDLRERKNTW